MATNEAEPVQQLQRTLYRTAKQSKAVKFYSLYDKVWRKDVLWEAWKQVRANRGAPGVDSETIEGIVSRGEEEQMLSCLQEQLRGKNYRFDPVRRVEYPEAQRGHPPAGDSDSARPRSADRNEAGVGADIRSRLSSLLLRLSSSEKREDGLRGDSRRPVCESLGRGRD